MECLGIPSLDTIEKIGSLFINLGTLVIAIYAYKTFLKNTFRNKQLDTVSELIKQVQQRDFQQVVFFKKSMAYKSQTLTLFDIALLEEFDEYDRVYFALPDLPDPQSATQYLNNQDIQKWDFFVWFYSDPFLPSSITRILKKFNNWHGVVIPWNDIQTNQSNFIVIGTPGNFSNLSRFLYVVGPLESGKQFRKTATQLRKTVTTWTKRYGIRDINLTSSHLRAKD